MKLRHRQMEIILEKDNKQKKLTDTLMRFVQTLTIR